MRKNYTVRRSDMVEYYDTEYISMPDAPQLWKIIHHNRKLVQINLDGLIGGEVREIW